MKKAKDSAVFYQSFFENLEEIENDSEYRKTVQAVWKYAFLNEEIELKNFQKDSRMVIRSTIPLLDAAKRNYENGCRGAEYGKLGGAPKGNQNARKNNPTGLNSGLNKNNPTVNDNDNYTDNLNSTDTDNYNDKEKDNKNVVCSTNNNFSIPSLAEIKAFCKEKSLRIDPDYFFNYYQQRNWELVTNWKACAEGWNRNQTKKIYDDSDPYAALRG